MQIYINCVDKDMNMDADFHGSKAAHPPQEKLVATPRRITPVFVFRLSLAVLFLLLFLTITLVYSQAGIDLHLYSFAGTKYQMDQVPLYSYRPQYSIKCNSTASPMVAACPANYPPISEQRNTSIAQPTCPEYMRWIHEDLKPWKKQGITREMIEEAEKIDTWRFRLIIVNGTAYIKTYGYAFHTRDTFTFWGVLQLLKRYPGKLPDVDLIFLCGDKTSIKKNAYKEDKAPPPLFHYCGSDDAYDIVFPDWTFWGWPDTNMKPWESLKKDLEDGNKMRKWTEREPYAFWRGNLLMGDRSKLRECNSTKDWNTLIYQQDWNREIQEGFKNSDLSKQCTHKYKIYIEGIGWSVSKKYILACDSMNLVVKPFYYDFFTRALVPLKHYWPIDPNNLCKSIKYAVDWGNENPNEARQIGIEGSKFIQDKITMQNVYDYMFHLLSEYGKLLRYKPTVPVGAMELCSETCVCARSELEQTYKVESMESGSATNGPCTLTPPFNEFEAKALKEEASKGFMQAKAWETTKETSI